MALTGKMSVFANLVDTKTSDLGSAVFEVHRSKDWTIATGTGSGQADRQWTDTRTLGSGASEDLDLVATLLNLFETLTFVKLKAVVVEAASTNTNNVRVTRASTGVPLFLAIGDGIDVPPGGFFAWAAPGAGITVTATTADTITIANSGTGTGVDYTVMLVGTSA